MYMENFAESVNLDFKYDGEDEFVLKDINISFKQGEMTAVLGHNGCGKSTFAKHLNAILLPSGGKVYVDGIDTKDENRIYDIRQRVGMVFQNPDNQIVATMVEEDVAFGPENMSVPTGEIWKRVEKALGAVGMTKFRHKSPLKLSGGQKQRVAIAGIIAMEPKCIILDEPTAMLDPVGRREVIKTLHQLNKEKGITIVLITHYMNEAIKADKIFVMDKGKLAMQGTPKEIFSRVDEIKGYGLEVPQVTELGYMLKKSGLDIEDGILTVDQLLEQINKMERDN